MNDNIFNALKDFVIKQAAVESKDITRGKAIEDDLGFMEMMQRIL